MPFLNSNSLVRCLLALVSFYASSSLADYASSSLAESLCGQLVNVKGSTKPIGFVIAADERANLPRDPFGLRMFDVDGAPFMDAVAKSTGISLNEMLELSRHEYLPLKKKGIFVCIDQFRFHNQSSAGGYILVVDTTEMFRIWVGSNLVYEKK
ncbi:MAG: hypothetical protein WCI18_11030 [Pseudomonadota bacterium]